MSQEVIARAGEIIAANIASEMPNCVISLIDLDGHPVSSVISPAKAEGIKWITFCTGLGNNKATRIGKCDRACVCFGTAEYNIPLVGTVEIITDPDVKRENWYTGLEQHFSGPDDPNYCVLKFTAKRYNLMVDWREIAGELQD